MNQTRESAPDGGATTDSATPDAPGVGSAVDFAQIGDAQAEDDQPRIVEEHHIVNADGVDDIEAIDSRGRRWYHPRPEPRGRADVLGVNYSWWLLTVVLLIVVFLPWGWWY